MKLVSHPASRPLAGTVRVPGDKSIGHRALLFSLLSETPVRVRGMGDGADNGRSARAISQLGATIAKASLQIAFSVSAASPTPPSTVTIDFCNDISPIIGFKCALPTCHGGNTPAEGLVLDPFSGIAMTAIGRVSQEANTGPRSLAAPPTLLFGEDMPILDATGTTGDPANSWMMYKLLLAVPTPEPVDAGAADDAGPGAVDAGAPDARSSSSSTCPTVPPISSCPTCCRRWAPTCSASIRMRRPRA